MSDRARTRSTWGHAAVAAFATALLASAVAVSQSTETLVVIVHASNPATSIDAALVQNVYLGRVKFWDDGQPIVAIGRPDNTPAGFALLKLLHMTPSHYRHYWLERQLSGQGSSPSSVPDASSAISQVAAKRGGICYLTEAEARQARGVKVLTIR